MKIIFDNQRNKFDIYTQFRDRVSCTSLWYSEPVLRYSEPVHGILNQSRD